MSLVFWGRYGRCDWTVWKYSVRDLLGRLFDLKVERSTRWATHEVIGKKPVVEYVGPGLASVSFTIQLNSLLGMPPIAVLKGLQMLMEKKEAQRLLIGPDYLGKFVIESVSEDRKEHTNLGIPVSGSVTITLKEVGDG